MATKQILFEVATPLQNRFPGVTVTASEPAYEDEGAACILLRLTLRGGDAPPSAILKCRADGGPLNPDELAAYEFLKALDLSDHSCAELYAHSTDHRFLLIEDLGGGQLGPILCNGDRPVA